MLKTDNQLTFGMMDDHLRRQKHTMLDEIDALIDFAPIEKLLETMYSKTTGRPPIPPLMLFKILLLQQWYGLSDPQVVEEIHDHRSFERFVGEQVRHFHVDDTTLVKFRNRLRSEHVLEELFAMFQAQLEARGLFVRQGTIIDSTLVEGATKPFRKRASGDPVDPDVKAVARPGDKVRDGYKVHVSMDEGSELIEKIELTEATVNDTDRCGSMVPEGTKAVYGDKGYSSKKNRNELRDRGIVPRILFRAARARKLTGLEKWHNGRWSKVRGAIERKMNDLKRWTHLHRLRYYTLERNNVQVVCAAIAVNLKRARILVR